MAGRSLGKTIKHRIEPEDLEIGQKIRAVRETRRVSQKTLARGLGVTFQQVQKYERGCQSGISRTLAEDCGDAQHACHVLFWRHRHPQKTRSREHLCFPSKQGRHTALARVCRDFVGSNQACACATGGSATGLMDVGGAYFVFHILMANARSSGPMTSA